MALTGVALAFSGAYTLLALALLAAMRQEIKHLDGRRLARSMVKILAAGAAMFTLTRGGDALLGAGSGAPGRAPILALVRRASVSAYPWVGVFSRMGEGLAAALLV